MAKLINEIEVETMGELRQAMASLPDDFPIYDGVGELLCIRIFEEGTDKWAEVM